MGFKVPTFTRLRAFAATASVLGITFAVAAQAPAMASSDVTPELGEPLSQEHVVATVTPSVVFISIQWEAWVGAEGLLASNDPGFWGRPSETGGTSIVLNGTCTGWQASSDGYIVTAAHCIDPDEMKPKFVEARINQLVNDGVIAQADAQGWYQRALETWPVEGHDAGSEIKRTVSVVLTRAASGLENREALEARVIDFQTFNEGDNALLKVETTTPLQVLQVADTNPQIGSWMLAVGYPGAVDQTTDPSAVATYNEGRVSGERQIRGAPFTQVSASINPGMSGGPTVDQRGMVLGMNSWYANEPTLSFTTRTSELKSLLLRNGVNNELSPADVAYREGLALYFAGDYAGAVAQFDTVLDAVPSHALAQQYKSDAAQKRAEVPASPTPTPAGTDILVPPDDPNKVASGTGGIPVPVFITVAALLALIVTGLAVALIRHRRSPGVNATNGEDA